MQLRLGSCLFRWTFLLVAVDLAFFRLDFLKHHKLAVDMHSRQLVDSDSIAVKPKTTKAEFPKMEADSIVRHSDMVPTRSRKKAGRRDHVGTTAASIW
jgi:hypothetical protein